MGWVELVSGALVVAVLVCVSGSAISKNRSTTTQLLRKEDKAPLPNIDRGEACEPYDKQSTIVIPLTADDNNIYNVDLKIKDEWIRAAVDTGSEALVVAGEDCDRCQLGKTQQGVVQMASSGVRTTMRYGSQSDTVEWETRPVSLKGWKFTCNPSDADSALTLSDTPPHRPVCVVGDIRLAVVLNRSGTSNYNVLGMGARSKRNNAPPSFLESIFPTPPRAFGIYIQRLNRGNTFGEGRLVLQNMLHVGGGASCAPPRHLFRISKNNLSSHQYLLEMLHIAVACDGADHTIEGHNYKLLLDTGANAISLPHAVYNKIKSMGCKKGALKFTLDDVDPDTRVAKEDKAVLRFQYDMTNTQNAQVLSSGGNKIIIGVTFMEGMGIGVYETEHERYVSVDY